MTYKHLTTYELTLIADFGNQRTKTNQVAKFLKQSQEIVYRVYRFLIAVRQYLQSYQRNKRRCGCGKTQLPKAEISYINKQIKAGHLSRSIYQ